MVISELLKVVTARLREAGIENSIFEAHQIVRHVFNFSAIDLVLNHNTDATYCTAKVMSLVERREKHEPLQYILGTQEFMSLEFLVEENVLIPRSDTETLVEFVLENTKGELKLLDIGTGTGCIPLSVAHYNKNAHVRGLDINPQALELSRKNAEKLGLSKRAEFEKIDILSQIPYGRYDVITSNPPYIETDIIPTLQSEVRDYEPHLALDGGCDGLVFYRRICGIAPKLLNPGGLLAFEIGYNQAGDVSDLMKNNFENIRITNDLAGNNRVVSGTLKQHASNL